MSLPVIQTSLVTGEIAPSLYGHTDLARVHTAAATMRNGFVGFRGGYYSRAGTKFVGFSRQTGRSVPPKMISFQQSLNQGLALEFGNFYMRVISEGAFVTESPLPISGITRANPGVLSLATGIPSAIANDGAVSASYAPGEAVTLAGGTHTVSAVVTIDTTRVQSLARNAAGAGYAAGDTINLAGGTQVVQAQVQVTSTEVVAASVGVPGNGSIPNGVQTAVVLGGAPGGGSSAQISVTVAGGVVIAINSISAAGTYTTNPPVLAQVVIAGNPSAFLNLAMGIKTFNLVSPGLFTANPGGAAFTQGSTTGAGTGATFNTVLMVPNDVHVSTQGAYTVFPSNPVAQASTTGSGAGVTFNIPAAPSISNGDWFYLSGIGGMTQLNGETVVASGVAGLTFNLTDVYGNNIDTSAFTAYTSGGTVARIYTLGTPWAEADLAYLKATQSTDVMSLCCVNQQTGTEYPAQDLTRFSDTNWSLVTMNPGASVGAPAAPTLATSSAGTVTYAYEITAVSPVDGTESIGSTPGTIASAVNIAATAGTITVSWTAIADVNQYNIYKASPGVGVAAPVGALYGYAGTAYGTQFLDSNVVPDFAQVPPTHHNPFARGQGISVYPTAGGSAYTDVGFTVNTSTGSGLVIEGVLIGGALASVVIRSRGQNYKPGDTITVTSGTGSGATVVFVVGPQSGTYPGVVTYFQERRAYGFTLNEPDTYFMSQNGAFTNFDSRIPVIETDAFSGSPWSVQVNGIQWMLPTSGGLLVFTGLQTWLLVGQGSFATNVAAISAAGQVANPQPEVGCSPILQPIKVNYDVLFVDSNSSFYYDQPYQLYTLSEPLDLTENSPHLFTGFSFVSHAWSRRPYKLLWSIRDDGAFLSLTFLKSQQVAGWARHDTQGLAVSNCAVFEAPVDAQYLAVQRFPSTKTAYMIERMDDRLWDSVEDSWCVDSGLALAQPTPNATLTANTAVGAGAVTGATGLIGGTGYSAATFVAVVDDGDRANGEGPGFGAIVAAPTIVGGVITAITMSAHGALYQQPRFVITDPAGSAGGSGASATAVLDNAVLFSTDVAIFAGGDVGKVIRAGGGIAQITVFTDNKHVTANMLSPIVRAIPNTNGTPQSALPGAWTMTAPVSTLSGLRHLIGASVVGVADGNPFGPVVVAADGTITLPTAASAVVAGLYFKPQLQSVYLDGGPPTIQGQRKKIAGVTIRYDGSRGLRAGSNQPDGAAQSPIQIAPDWFDLADVPDNGANFPLKPYNALATPLRTGDIRVAVSGGFDTRGQVAVEQPYPLPMDIVALISDLMPGDSPQTQWRGHATKGGGSGSQDG